jgi:hypothetical protein
LVAVAAHLQLVVMEPQMLAVLVVRGLQTH